MTTDTSKYDLARALADLKKRHDEHDYLYASAQLRAGHTIPRSHLSRAVVDRLLQTGGFLLDGQTFRAIKIDDTVLLRAFEDGTDGLTMNAEDQARVGRQATVFWFDDGVPVVSFRDGDQNPECYWPLSAMVTPPSPPTIVNPRREP